MATALVSASDANPIAILPIKEVASYLRLSSSTVYRMVKGGKIPAFKIGSDWRFKVDSIDRWRLRQGGLVDEQRTE